MEKSFLNFKVGMQCGCRIVLMIMFQAANPQWNPTDPTGSLYLSRMAEYGTGGHFPHPALPKRATGHHRFDTIRFETTDAGTSNRTPDYDRALQQSMARASARKRSIPRSRTRTQDGNDQTPIQSVSLSAIRDEDKALDGGVGSELGDSYVEDIRMQKAGKTFLPVASERQEDDELQDAGVLGLLGQIYSQGRTVL